MGKPVKTYDLKAVYLTIGGYRIGGWGQEGGITVEWGADLVESTVGADGEAAISRTNNNSAMISITVLENTLSYKNLADLLDAQQDEEAIARLEFSFEDEINGDKITDEYAVFVNRPQPNKGRKSGERIFKVFLANAGENAVFGANITI